MATTLPNTVVQVDRVGARELLMPTRVLALALLVGHLPLLIVHFHNLFQHRPHYEFVPFLLVAAAILAWKRRPVELTPVGRGAWLTGWATLACSMALLAGATLVHSPWLAAVSSILSCGGLVLITTGRRGVAELLPVWLLLWLTVPPPFLLDRELIQFLQTLTSESSSQLMQWLGILHFRAGNVFRLPGQMLFVAEACSGVHSQLILIAAAALLGVGRRRSLVHVVCLMLAALFWSIVANVARVTIVVAGVSRGWPLAEGWPHELLGYALVLLGFLAILSTDVLLRMLLAPLPPLATDESEGDDIDGMPRDRLDLSLDRLFHACWNGVVSGGPSSAGDGARSGTEAPGAVDRFLPERRLIAPGTAGVFGMLCVGLASLQIMAMMSTASDPLVDGTTLFASVRQESMPDRMDGWQRVGHETAG
jgi:exosortase